MTKRTHHYVATISWTGNRGAGTSEYKGYSRDHEIAIPGKPLLHGSSDHSFRGDGSRHNPEDLLVASLSGCHMLWYLHLCATHGVIVSRYVDEAKGEMQENDDGSGQFLSVTLYPEIVVAENSMIDLAASLHERANAMCFIARSVNFPVYHKPNIRCYEKA